MMNIRCPYCGDQISPMLEYTSMHYSEHRDFVGYECDNYQCGAEWDKSGDMTVDTNTQCHSVCRGDDSERCILLPGHERWVASNGRAWDHKGNNSVWMESFSR